MACFWKDLACGFVKFVGLKAMVCWGNWVGRHDFAGKGSAVGNCPPHMLTGCC